MPMSQRVLRQRLQNILNEEQGKLHEKKVVQLASHCRGAFIEPVHFSSQKLQAFNCFMYVLNLLDRLEPNVFQQDNEKIGFFVNSSFFTKLHDADILSETSIDQLETNDLVVYYKGQQKVHAGRYIAPNLVESKWGLGPLFRHGLWDVPKSYGEALKYFKAPEQAKVDAFIKRELPLVQLAPLEPHKLPALTDGDTLKFS